MENIKKLLKQIVFIIPGIITYYGMALACLIVGVAAFKLYSSRPGNDVILCGTVLIVASIACAASGCVTMKESFCEIRDTFRLVKRDKAAKHIHATS